MTATVSLRQAERRAGVVHLAALGLCLACAVAQGQEIAPPARKATEPYAPLPTPERVFRLESETQLRERMTREARVGLNPLHLKYDIIFPDYPDVPSPTYVPRPWQPLVETVETPYLSYNRLFFEQINAERYGWDLGPVHPLLSAGIFYLDVVTLPYHLGTQPCRRYESDAGYCLPGDPVPLLLYPPENSWTGMLAEAATVGLLVAIFP
jgi:hypothetical protein